MEVRLDKDEWYPVRTIFVKGPGVPVVVDDDFLEYHDRVLAEFEELQKKLRTIEESQT